MTEFSAVYNSFLSKITDDMYMELTKEDTMKMLFPLMENAIPWFEFPRQDITNYDEELGAFNIDLTKEEINIISDYMIVEWMGQQLASVDNTRMQYSGTDFKFTSQANHMAKIKTVKEDYERIGFHHQRLYKRRKKDSSGAMKSTFGVIMGRTD